MRTRLFLLFLLLVIVSNYPSGYEEKIFDWPLKINNGYSSAFQEFRSGHFHGGIDLRTFQKTGYPVLSVMEGSIYKIRYVKRGSGKGIYVSHSNGLKSIYFHLDRFSDPVEKIIEKIQRKKGTKYIGNYFLADPIRVGRGEIIGYSGETGSGFPHLHLEIRDSDEKLLNPFKLIRFPSEDRNPPVLKKLIIRTVGNTAVDGRVGERTYSFNKLAGNEYTVNEKITLNGEFEFVLNSFDISDTGKHVAPSRVELLLENKRLFSLKFESFTHDDNNQLGFVYDMFFSSSSSYFFNLFSQTGFSMAGDSISTGDIFKMLKPGENNFKIYVYDNFNNAASAEFIVDKYRTPSLNLTLSRDTDKGSVLIIKDCDTDDISKAILTLKDEDKKTLTTEQITPDDIFPGKEFPVRNEFAGEFTYAEFEFFREEKPVRLQTFSFDNDQLGNISDLELIRFVNRDSMVIKIDNDRIAGNNILLDITRGKNKSQVLPETDAENLFFHFKPAGPGKDLSLTFTILNNNEPAAYIQKDLSVIVIRDGMKQNPVFNDFSIYIGNRAVREPHVMSIEKVSFPSSFPLISDQYMVYPYSFPFLDTVYFKFTMKAENPRQAGIFKYSLGSGKWYYSGTSYNEAKQLFYTRSITPGIYGLMRDIFKPEIRFSHPAEMTKNNLNKLKIYLTDKGKGIDDDTIIFELNGKPMPAEYDPDWKTLVPEELGSRVVTGSNLIRVAVSDRGGNRETGTLRFKIQEVVKNRGE